ncbi:gliding motility lipoprotein GldB [Aquimarina sp. U1-2]|uniref:gliding motility lipoprotein GldB n=1 Tax=Aquimarina sp. U1-2 TaxID=2823141 RepID=UPI003530289F
MNCKKLVVYVLFFCFLLSCKNKSEREEAIAQIPVTIEIERFDRSFAGLTKDNLADLKLKYPFLFAKQYADSIWLNRSKDTIQIELNKEVEKAFPDLSREKEQLLSLFQHITYYFPEISTPKVVTITSDVDYRNSVVIAKGLLIISLDVYLGEDHHFYESIQKYLRQNFKREQILPNVAAAYAKNLVGPIRERTFLGNLISFGKELYLTDKFLPDYSDAQKIGYSDEQYAWAQANEEEIWRYFIDKQLLYSTESDLLSRFLYPAPFSKFYLQEIDKEAPDRIGQFIGWQIVAAYMKNNNVSLRQLVLADAETIFNRSKYKPAR